MLQGSRPRPKNRLAQVDSRHRLTVSEADASTVYVVAIRDDDALVLYPLAVRRSGRRVNVDARRRIQIAEMTDRGLYLVAKHPNGVIELTPAVTMPKQEFLRMKADFSRKMVLA